MLALADHTKDIINGRLIAGGLHHGGQHVPAHTLGPGKESANAAIRPQRRIELSMRQQARLQATEECLQVAALGKVNRRTLYAILTHQNDGAACVAATILMAMHIDNLVHIDVQRIAPVVACLVRAIGIVVAIHQLIRRPLDGQRLDTLMQTEVARHGLSHILGQHQHIVLAIEQCGA